MGLEAAIPAVVFYVVVFAGVGAVLGAVVRHKGPILAVAIAVAVAIGSMNGFLAPHNNIGAGLFAFVFSGVVIAVVALIANALRKWPQ